MKTSLFLTSKWSHNKIKIVAESHPALHSSLSVYPFHSSKSHLRGWWPVSARHLYVSTPQYWGYRDMQPSVVLNVGALDSNLGPNAWRTSPLIGWTISSCPPFHFDYLFLMITQKVSAFTLEPYCITVLSVFLFCSFIEKCVQYVLSYSFPFPNSS